MYQIACSKYFLREDELKTPIKKFSVTALTHGDLCSCVNGLWSTTLYSLTIIELNANLYQHLY